MHLIELGGHELMTRSHFPHLRRGARWGVPLIAASLTVILTSLMFTASPVWRGWLPTTISKWEDASVLATPAWGVAAALIASAHRAPIVREYEMISHRTTGARWALLKLIIPWAAASQLAVLVAMLAGTGRSNTWPTGGWAATLGLCVVELGAVVASIAFGVWVGTSLATIVALPLSLFAPYAYNVALVAYAGDSDLVPLFSSADGSGWDYVIPYPISSILRASWWVAFAALLLALALRKIRWVRPLLATCACAVAINIVLPPAWTPIPGADDPVCVGERPRVCVERTFAVALPQYDADIRSLLAPIPVQARPDLVTPKQPSPDQRDWAIMFNPNSRLPAARDTRLYFGYSLFSGPPLSEAEAEAGAVPAEPGDGVSPLLGWLLAKFGEEVPYVEEAKTATAARFLDGLSQQQRDLWFITHRDTLRAGQLQMSDFA